MTFAEDGSSFPVSRLGIIASLMRPSFHFQKELPNDFANSPAAPHMVVPLKFDRSTCSALGGCWFMVG